MNLILDLKAYGSWWPEPVQGCRGDTYFQVETMFWAAGIFLESSLGAMTTDGDVLCLVGNFQRRIIEIHHPDL